MALLQCGQCMHKMTTTTKLQKHMKNFHGRKIHRCPYCDYKTSKKMGTEKHLDNHMKTVHHQLFKWFEIKDLMCPHCEYTSNTSSDLAQHVRVIHDRVKDKICPHCDYASHYSSTLDFHITVVHNKFKNTGEDTSRYKHFLAQPT